MNRSDWAELECESYSDELEFIEHGVVEVEVDNLTYHVFFSITYIEGEIACVTPLKADVQEFHDTGSAKRNFKLASYEIPDDILVKAEEELRRGLQC